MMSDGELIASFRQAKDPRGQIRVLAELNAVSEFAMHAHLARLGLDVGEPPAPPPAPVPQRPLAADRIDGELARQMIADGATDRELASAFGVGLSTMRSWLNANRLKAPTCHKKPKAKPAPKQAPAAPTDEVLVGHFADTVMRLASAFPTATLCRPEGGTLLQLKICDPNAGDLTLFLS